MKKYLSAFILISYVFSFSAASAANLDKFSRQLSKGVAGLSSKKVAVISFLYHDSKFSSGSSIIAERLTTSLVGKNRIVVIERRLIKKILEEQKMNEMGIIDASTAKKIGSVLGVDAIVTGTLIDLDGNKTEVNARMIDSETGRILSAAQLMIDRTWQDKPRTIVAAPPAAVPPAPEPVAEEVAVPVPSGPSIRLSNENFPPGRRAYHRETGTPEETKSRASGEAEYDSGYGDGYYDGQSSVRGKKEKKEPHKKEERSLTDRRLEESKREKPRRILK